MIDRRPDGVMATAAGELRPRQANRFVIVVEL